MLDVVELAGGRADCENQCLAGSSHLSIVTLDVAFTDLLNAAVRLDEV